MIMDVVEAVPSRRREAARRVTGEFPGVLEPAVLALIDQELRDGCGPGEAARRRMAGMFAARITTRLPLEERPCPKFVFAAAHLPEHCVFARRQLEQFYAAGPDREVVDAVLRVASNFAALLLAGDVAPTVALRLLRGAGGDGRAIAALTLALRRPGGPLVVQHEVVRFVTLPTAA